MFLMMVMQIPTMRARDELMMMDAAVYGNRVHAGKEAQISFDMEREQVKSFAYPRARP